MRSRRIAIAKILTYKDQFIDPYLPKEVAVEFRKVVLDAIGEIEGETVMNELYLERLQALAVDVEAIRDAVT